MKTLGIFEVKTHLGQLINDGEEVAITRHGKLIAKLTPEPQEYHNRIGNIINDMKQLRKHASLDGLSWKDLRDEGRK